MVFIGYVDDLERRVGTDFEDGLIELTVTDILKKAQPRRAFPDSHVPIKTVRVTKREKKAMIVLPMRPLKEWEAKKSWLRKGRCGFWLVRFLFSSL